MNVPLKRQDEEWLESQVATGRFSSVAEAVAAAVAKLKSDDAIDDQWAKPLIDEALAALDRGERSRWQKGDVLKTIKATRAGSA